MNAEPIIQLEEVLERLEHTRKCVTERLYYGEKCCCKLQMIIDATAEYKMNVWKEMRSG